MRTIAFVTDIHLDEVYSTTHGVDPYHNWQLLLADVASRKIDEVVFGGDIGASTAYPYFFNSLKELGIAHKVLIGNHDNYADAIAIYHEPLQIDHPELYYSYDMGQVRYLFLDSSTQKISALQLHWLVQQLDTTHTIILYIHHPVLPVNTPVDTLYPLLERKELTDTLLKSSRSINIYCGHYHMPHRQVLGNISQYITPAASYQIREHATEIETDAEKFGYRLITVGGNQISSELIWLKA